MRDRIDEFEMLTSTGSTEITGPPKTGHRESLGQMISDTEYCVAVATEWHTRTFTDTDSPRDTTYWAQKANMCIYETIFLTSSVEHLDVQDVLEMHLTLSCRERIDIEMVGAGAFTMVIVA